MVDTTENKKIEIDTNALHANAEKATWQSYITNIKNITSLDIEQSKEHEINVEVFVLILFLLLLLTYVKLSHSNDFSNLFRAFSNGNIASQIFRTQKQDFSSISIFLYIIFLLGLSVFSRQAWLHYHTSSFLQSKISILVFIFLFTFFFVAKYISMKVIGKLFDVSEFMSEYIFQVGIMLKTIGIIIIPALLVEFVGNEEICFCVEVFVAITSIVLLSMAFMRGLSTAYKLMYRSLYHFLLYICIQEVLTVFLFLKLLTKTAT